MRYFLVRLFQFALITAIFGALLVSAQARVPAALYTDSALAAAGDSVLSIEEIIGGPQVVYGVAGSQAYAYAGSRMLLYEVSFPNHPVLLSQFIPYPGEVIRSASLYLDRYAFVLTSTHFTVFDLRAFSQPVAVSSMNNVAWDRIHVHNNLLVLAGSYQMNLYQINSPDSIVSLSGTSFATYPQRDVFLGNRYYRALTTGLEIIDFSDPLNIKTYTSAYTLTWSVYGLAVRLPYVFLHGYVENRGYALQTLNVSNLSSPQVVYTGDSQYGNYMTAVGNYGYACSGSDLQIFDLTDPAHPYYLGQPNHPCHTGGFLAGTRYYSGSSIFDISDPAFPRLLGLMTAGIEIDHAAGGQPAAEDQNRVYAFGGGYLSIYEANGPGWRYLGGLGLSNLFYSKIHAAFPYLYLLDYNSLDILNVSSPVTPWVMAHYDALFTSPRAVTFYTSNAQNFLYVVHDSNRLAVINVTNPLDPETTVQTANLDLPDIGQSLVAAGGRLFVAAGSAGVRAYSLADPSVPVYQATFAALNAQSLAAKGNRLFIATGSNVSVVDTGSLALKSVISIPANQVLVYGSLLYVRSSTRLNVFDITNPDAPRWISFTNAGNLYGDIFSGLGGAYWLQNTGLLSYLAPQPVESKVFSSSGGQFTAADGSFQADFPPCAVAESNVLFESIRSMSGAGSPAAHMTAVHPVRDFLFVRGNGNYAGSAYCPFTLQVNYQEQNIAGLDESSLAVYYWQGAAWIKAPTSTLDTENQVVTAEIPTGVITWGLFAALPGTPQQLYLPIAQTALSLANLNAPAGIDFSIQRIEPIQATNTATGLSPLVAGKPTAVRVYVASGTALPVYGVRLALHGTRGSLPLPGSPLIVDSWAVMPVSFRENLETTFNINLPASWLQAGTITLTAVADDNGRFGETNEGNNSGAVSATFNGLNPLQIVFVPINYTHTPTGTYFPHAENTDLSYDLRQMFPIPGVSVSYRTPVNWAGDLSLGEEWSRLISFIKEVRTGDGVGKAVLYYGVIPTRNANGDTYKRAWGGYGYYSPRVSIGVQGSTSVFAHEAGHNFGLAHAPCGGPAGVNPSYPYPDGRIGQFGVSAATLTGYNPVITKDYMTYCYPEWISDYYYQSLYDNQRSVGGTSAAEITASQDVLVLRAFTGPDGIAIQPVYRVEQGQLIAAGSEDQLSTYWVDLLDAQGAVLASANLVDSMLASEDLDGKGYTSELYARIPAVEGAVRLVIRQSENGQAGGVVVGERDLFTSPDDSAAQAVDVQFVEDQQSLAWSGLEDLLRVSLRAAESQPWQLYALDWPATQPLVLPPGQWQVHWSTADHTGPGYTFVP